MIENFHFRSIFFLIPISYIIANSFFYLDIDSIQYWVDDGCVTGGKEIEGSFQKTSYLAGVRCCSDDGSTCETPGSCPADNKSFNDAKQKCAELGKRLCTKNELTSGVCCGTGGKCDLDGVWTSNPFAGKKSFSFDIMSTSLDW